MTRHQVMAKIPISANFLKRCAAFPPIAVMLVAQVRMASIAEAVEKA
jgi:hypothetical protein